MKTRTLISVMLASLVSMCTVSAQNLTGTLVANDTGKPIAGATVLAIQKGVSTSQTPVTYKARSDGNGRFAMTVIVGQYSLCIHESGLYLNPCQWGGAKVVAVAATAVTDGSLRLDKGAKFIVRTHDNQGLLRQAEALAGGRMDVSLIVPPSGMIPLPVVYDNGRIRDYGAVLPFNVPMTVKVSAGRLALVDGNGAALSAQGIPFQITASDFPPATGSARLPGFMFAPPDAKFIHVHATGIH